MKIKQISKIGGCLLGGSMLVFLAACSSNSNPLKTAEPDSAAEFLVQASKSAEKELKIFNAPGGYYYGLCMNGKETPSLCNKLYQAMATYAKTTTDFKALSANQLADKKVFKPLKDDYNRIRFNTI